MVISSCVSRRGSPHPVGTSNASTAKAAVSGVASLLTSIEAVRKRLERIVGGAGESGFGEPNLERGAHAHLAFHREAAAVQLNDLLAYSEPQSTTPGGPRAIFIDSVEPVEEVREVLFGNAEPCIRDTHGHEGSVFQYANVHPRAGIGVLDRVIEEVEQDLVNLLRVTNALV